MATTAKHTFLHFLIFHCILISAEPEYPVSPLELIHGDYTPPSPPPPSPPPHPPPSSCQLDLNGTGSFDTTCILNHSLNFTDDVYIEGKGNFIINPNVNLTCQVLGCVFTFNLSGEFKLGLNSTIVAGTVYVLTGSAIFDVGSMVNVSALGGLPPAATSGSPDGVDGAGGGHGGRGASCLLDNTKLPEDVWGGDAYSWLTLDEPSSYGSKGGTTKDGEDFGGEGGGRIWIEVKNVVEAYGNFFADGGDGGIRGGGGSGGSFYVKCLDM